MEYKCYDQSYDHLKTALERNKEFTNDSGAEQYQLYILKLLAQTCLESHRIKESLLYLEEAEEICKENEDFGNDGKDYAQILAFKGDYYYMNEKYGEAIDCFEKVWEIYEKLDGKDSEGCANSLKQIAKIYDSMGNVESALQCLEECIGTFFCD